MGGPFFYIVVSSSWLFGLAVKSLYWTTAAGAKVHDQVRDKAVESF